MGLEVLKGYFEKREEVLDDIKASGFWPSTFVSGPSPGIEVHWHDLDVHAYVMEGTTRKVRSRIASSTSSPCRRRGRPTSS